MKKIIRFNLIVLLIVIAFSIVCNRNTENVQSVIFITIDTLRADHLPFYGYPRKTAPFLSELKEKGILFKKCYAPTSQTSPSHASMFTSLFPLQHGISSNGELLKRDMVTISDIFKQNKFLTSAFISVRFLDALKQGFQYFDFYEEKRGSVRKGKETTDSAIQWLQKREQDDKFFMWVHLFDVHQYFFDSEYSLYSDYREIVEKESSISNDELKKFLSVKYGTVFHPKTFEHNIEYDARIRFVDQQIKRLFDTVNAQKFKGNILWVITADHGEGLGSHNYRHHDKYLYNEQVQVPLLFYFSNENFKGQVINKMVRHIDLLPTIMDFAGIPLDKVLPKIEGHSLVAEFGKGNKAYPVKYSFAQRARPNQSQLNEGWIPGGVYSLQNDKYKYIFYSKGKNEFYNLLEDPLELNNLIDKPSKPLDEIKALLDFEISKLNKRYGSDSDHRIQEEHINALKTLGYL